MPLDNLPLWAIAISFALNVVFLRRLLGKVDRVYNWICGTPEKPGIADRIRRLEAVLDIQPEERRHSA